MSIPVLGEAMLIDGEAFDVCARWAWDGEALVTRINVCRDDGKHLAETSPAGWLSASDARAEAVETIRAVAWLDGLPEEDEAVWTAVALYLDDDGWPRFGSHASAPTASGLAEVRYGPEAFYLQVKACLDGAGLRLVEILLRRYRRVIETPGLALHGVDPLCAGRCGHHESDECRLVALDQLAGALQIEVRAALEASARARALRKAR